MTYHHVIRIRDNNGLVKYERQQDEFVNPDYWENWYWDKYLKNSDGAVEIVCVNVYKGEE